jgi:hypothetical protein
MSEPNAFSRILATEPSSVSATLADITKLTPERAKRWDGSSSGAVSHLQKGVRACTIVVGEEVEAKALVEGYKRLIRFRIELAQRELIVEVCKSSLHAHST